MELISKSTIIGMSDRFMLQHQGNLDLLKTLLDRGADVNSAGGDPGCGVKGSAIQDAAYRGDSRIVQYLIERDAQIDMYGQGLPNALQNAAAKGYISLVKLLLGAGAKLEGDGGHGTALHSAIAGNRPEVILFLLECGADPNSVSEYRDQKTTPLPNPLLHATIQGHLEIVKIVLENGADVNAPSKYWGSSELPLQNAAGKGSIEILRTFLEHGANVDAQTEDGWTAIHWAARNGHHEALRLLIFDYHANTSLSLVNGSLALHSAASHGYPKCIEVCLEAGLDVSACNNVGRTALHWATEKGYQAAVELLLERGVDVEVKEVGTNMTALDCARLKASEQSKNTSRLNLVKVLKAKELGAMSLAVRLGVK